MKKLTSLFATLFLATTLLLTACGEVDQPDGVTAQETPIHMSDYKGKWVVVNYWAVWCEPCLAELPELNNLYENHKDNVMVLGVSFDYLTDKDIRDFSHSLGVTFPMLVSFNLQKFGGIQEVETLPVTFIFSPDGELVQTLNGPQTEESLLKVMGLLPM
jgi:thiol-disulfide isomerase/thioredoxin